MSWEAFSFEWYPNAASGTKVCCPKAEKTCLFFPGEEKPECAREEDDPLEYKSVEEIKEFFAVGAFNNFTCDDVPGTECKSLEQCSTEDFKDDYGFALAQKCGFDSSSRQYKFCCLTDGSGEKVRTEKDVDLKSKKGTADYSAEDHVKECKEWAKKFPESCTDERHSAFAFMMMACSKSCDIREKCVDEFEACQELSSNFKCIDNTIEMSLYCRKTCANCGFLSPRNRESQVVKARSYSETDDEAFHCGESIKIDSDYEYGDFAVGDDNKDSSGKEEEVDSSLIRFGEDNNASGEGDVEEEKEHIDKDGVWGFVEDSDMPPPNCGFTAITDRVLVTAAHCVVIGGQDYFANNDGTAYFDIIPFRRSFVHPYFEFSAYNDIAIIELGKRIEYDMDTRGQEPTCLGRAEKYLVGKVGAAEGYGGTEAGTVSEYKLTVNLTVKDNAWCAEQLRVNFRRHLTNKAKLRSTLFNGLNDQLICTRGDELIDSAIKIGEKVHGDVCRGDSGGALYIQHEPGIDTLEAIVSGGVGVCGAGYPRWWIKGPYTYNLYESFGFSDPFPLVCIQQLFYKIHETSFTSYAF